MRFHDRGLTLAVVWTLADRNGRDTAQLPDPPEVARLARAAAEVAEEADRRNQSADGMTDRSDKPSHKAKHRYGVVYSTKAHTL